jgi:lincosamide nucleotidyltransferase A/C/D/E
VTNPAQPSDPELAELLSDFPKRDHPSENAVMDEEEAGRVLSLAEIAGIPVVVDGGWAVDALLGWQTREHSDLDLAINQQYLRRFLNILRRLDYQYLPRGDEWAANFVLENGCGHQVDLHTFVRNIKGQIVGGVEYPGDSLTGQGKIAGANVSCIHPEWLVDFHLGYDFDHEDYQDVFYICNLFKLKLPAEYEEYALSLYEGLAPGKRQVPGRFSVRVPQNPADYLAFTNILDKKHSESISSELQAKILMMLEGVEPPQLAKLDDYREIGLRSGVILVEEQRVIGACELVCPLAVKTKDPGSNNWAIRQMTLQKRAEYSSLFMALVRKAIGEAFRAGADNVEVLPLDDITQPRPALPTRYDTADIGYASFYARAGFRRLEPVPGSRWICEKNCD